ncbi:MAG TPA: hypothetical protein DE036_07055 [Actinobacteria bacterium]|nr:hypothetical protein [Actinomycetota bacterium]
MSDFEHEKDILELLDDDDERPMTKSERTRLKIMAGAARAFNDKGFENTSIQDIADTAGVAKGTIYYYIEKKEDLLLSLLEFGQARLFARIDKSIGRETTAAGKIELIIRNHLRIVKVVGPIIPHVAQNIVTADSKIQNSMAKLRKRYLALLESVIKEGVDSGEFREVRPDKAALVVMSLVLGQILQHKIFVGKLNAREIIASTMDFALNGLRKADEG